MGREKTDRRESRKLHNPAGLAKGFGNAYPLANTRREAMAVVLKTHRFTVDEYHRMGEARDLLRR